MKDLEIIVNVLNKRLAYQSKDWKAFVARLTRDELVLYKQLKPRTKFLRDSSIDTSKSELNISNSKVYKSLCEKLKNEILNFNPDESKASSYLRNQVKCIKLSSILSFLLGANHYEFAKSIAYELLSISTKFRITDQRLLAHQYLHKYYTTYFPNTREAKKHLQAIPEILQLLNHEIDIESLNNEMMALILANANTESHEWRKVEESFSSFKDIANGKKESFKFYLRYYDIGVKIHEIKGEFNFSLQTAKDAFHFFHSHGKIVNGHKAVFMLHITDSLLRLGKLDEARDFIHTSLKVFKSININNWLYAKWLLMSIELCSKNYAQAAEQYSHILSNESLKSALKHRRKSFKSARPYFYLLWKTGKIEEYQIKSIRNVSKIDLTIPEFDHKDERDNVPLLISQIGYYILKSKYSSISKVLSELQRYGKEKIRSQNKNYRTYVFINILSCIKEGYFNPVAIKRKVNPLLKKLSSKEYVLSGELQVPEIIPYEELWKMFISHLKPPKRNVNKRLLG